VGCPPFARKVFLDSKKYCQISQSHDKPVSACRRGRLTIVDADLILVLANGQLVERGTHEELLARRGEYHDLVQTQASPALA
jgi:ABC-type transport system involved in Fe-S cluster assembly fused permease/ATPase subunit